jgi:hypothetical protein
VFHAQAKLELTECLQVVGAQKRRSLRTYPANL